MGDKMEVVVNSVITVSNPTEELLDWCEDNLTLDNPDYAKKQRMGFWTGNTPKKLSLFEIHGNKIVLPYGTLNSIAPMIKDAQVRSGFAGWLTTPFLGETVHLFDYQESAVKALLNAKYGILQSPAGSGKTQMGIELIKRFKLPALWLTHTKDLLNQSKSRAVRYMDPDLIGTITEGQVHIGKGVTFATIQTMSKLDLRRYRDQWAVVIVDECFSANTPIKLADGTEKPIRDIEPGQWVESFDDKSKTLVPGRVVRVMRRIPKALIKLTYDNDMTLVCTPSHPLYTLNGWTYAGDLKKGDVIIGAGMDRRTPQTRLGGNGENQPEICLRTNETQQSVAKTGSTGKNLTHASANETSPSCTRREWQGLVEASANDGSITGKVSSRLRICNTDQSAEDGISESLQDRHCLSTMEFSDRDRRQEPLFTGATSAGQEERAIFTIHRVDGIEILESGSDGTFGGLLPGGRVYNFEVEQTHTYVANGLIVHNCHHAAGTPTMMTRFSKVLNALSAPYKFGLSATVHRADGLIKSVYALLGDIVYTVPDEAVTARIMKVGIIPIGTGAVLTEDCLKSDGTLDYAGMINVLCIDADRNRLIRDTLVRNADRPSLILSDRVDHLETLMEMLPDHMRSRACVVHGKTKKSEREQAMEDMRVGRKDYLFATYALAREGLDIPRLEALHMTTPVKDEAVVIQSIGRVARVCDGKTDPVAFDYVDLIPYCRRAYKQRQRLYRKIGAYMRDGL